MAAMLDAHANSNVVVSFVFAVAVLPLIYLWFVVALNSDPQDATALQTLGSWTSVASYSQSASDSATGSHAGANVQRVRPMVLRREHGAGSPSTARAVDPVPYADLGHHHAFRSVRSNSGSESDVQGPLRVYMYPLPRDLNIDLLLVVSAALRRAVRRMNHNDSQLEGASVVR